MQANDVISREETAKRLEALAEQRKGSFSGEAFEFAAKVVRGVPTAVQWIPVSERLPNKEEYTEKTEDGTEYYVRLLIAYKTDIVEYEIGYYDGYKWMTEMPIRIIKDAVAWMPFPNMPEPPKGGNRLN